MSDYSQAKPIQRAEIASPSSSRRSSIDLDLDARYHAQLTALYGSVASEGHEPDDPIQSTHQDQMKEAVQAGDTFSFRLFNSSSAASAKVVVRSPTPTHREPGFVVSRRPDAFYFASPAGDALKEQYCDVAVSGEQILGGLKVPWPGCHLPWRVTSIKDTEARKAENFVSLIETGKTSTRTRTGKKRRVAIRKRIAALKEEQLRAQEAEKEKAAVEREKRTRRNREKKVKKKKREKLKKAQDANVEGHREHGNISDPQLHTPPTEVGDVE